jgi:D-lactate dehydrogenase
MLVGDILVTVWADTVCILRLLLLRRQVLVTPHSAFLTHEALANIGQTTVQNITEFLSGKPLTNELKVLPGRK